MSAPFTADEKARIRYHLGYLNVQEPTALSFGIPRPLQTVFLIESAMNNVIDAARDKVRQIIGIMDGVECRLVDAQERLAASKLDTLTMRVDEPDALEKEYMRWGLRLADLLGVPPYPYSTRYSRLATSRSGSIPVRG